MNSGPSANFVPQLDLSEHSRHVPSTEDRRRAVLTVAAFAADAEECAELLCMLGLDPHEGKTP